MSPQQANLGLLGEHLNGRSPRTYKKEVQKPVLEPIAAEPISEYNVPIIHSVYVLGTPRKKKVYEDKNKDIDQIDELTNRYGLYGAFQESPRRKSNMWSGYESLVTNLASPRQRGSSYRLDGGGNTKKKLISDTTDTLESIIPGETKTSQLFASMITSPKDTKDEFGETITKSEPYVDDTFVFDEELLEEEEKQFVQSKSFLENKTPRDVERLTLSATGEREKLVPEEIRRGSLSEVTSPRFSTINKRKSFPNAQQFYEKGELDYAPEYDELGNIIPPKRATPRAKLGSVSQKRTQPTTDKTKSEKDAENVQNVNRKKQVDEVEKLKQASGVKDAPDHVPSHSIVKLKVKNLEKLDLSGISKVEEIENKNVEEFKIGSMFEATNDPDMPIKVTLGDYYGRITVSMKQRNMTEEEESKLAEEDRVAAEIKREAMIENIVANFNPEKASGKAGCKLQDIIRMHDSKTGSDHLRREGAAYIIQFAWRFYLARKQRKKQALYPTMLSPKSAKPIQIIPSGPVLPSYFDAKFGKNKFLPEYDKNDSMYWWRMGLQSVITNVKKIRYVKMFDKTRRL